MTMAERRSPRRTLSFSCRSRSAVMRELLLRLLGDLRRNQARPPTHKIRPDVRFNQKATKLLRGNEMTPMCQKAILRISAVTEEAAET